MLHRALAILIAIFCYLGSVEAQDCTCLQTVEWALKAFEANDAGYNALLLEKGENPQAEVRSTLLAQAAETESLAACGPLVFNYLMLFRKQHLGFSRQVYMEEPGSQQAPLRPEEIIAAYSNEPVYQANTNEEFVDTEQIEGDYTYATYTVRVLPVGNEPTRYIAYILEADGVYWKKDQVKFELTATDDGIFDALFRNRNHELTMERFAYRLDATRLLVGGYIWKSTDSDRKGDAGVDRQIMAAESDRPVLYRHDANTMVIRFPDFGSEWSDYTDSLVAANYGELTATPKLIVDLRGNGGGSDRTYERIMDLIRTRPRTTEYEVSFYNSTANRSSLQRRYDAQELPNDILNYLEVTLDQLKGEKDVFVILKGDSSEASPKVYQGKYPQRVAVLIDRWCGSSGEQFALDARESWKVKLFGEPTIGGIDASNLMILDDPCGNYRLIYSSTITSRAAIIPIDGIGVQPDYPLELSQNPYQVISTVARLMEE